MREKAIETHLRNRFLEVGGRSLKLAPVGESGWPDRLCLLPGGVVAFAELKAPGQKARPLQQHRLQTLRDLGFVAVELDSRTSVDQFIEQLLDGSGT